MCVYCMIGDHIWKYDPPWTPMVPIPFVPEPVSPKPNKPWNLDRLRELEDLLQRIKELEDKVGCPCEPNKADYLKLIRNRIVELEKVEAERKQTRKKVMDSIQKKLDKMNLSDLKDLLREASLMSGTSIEDNDSEPSV